MYLWISTGANAKMEWHNDGIAEWNGFGGGSTGDAGAQDGARDITDKLWQQDGESYFMSFDDLQKQLMNLRDMLDITNKYE